MGKDTKTKIGFEIADNFHTILSVHENKIGELTILPSFALNYSEIEFGRSDADKKIKNQHYTVHNSLHLEDENVLNHTLEYVDSTKTNTRIYTRAFKRTNLSCPVKTATLYYMIVVGNSGVTFNEEYPDINIVTIQFQSYSMSLLWSFGLVPSHSTGSKSHFLTDKDFETQWKEGFSNDEIINVYRLTRQLQHLSFLTFLQQQFEGKASSFDLIKGIGFKKLPELSIEDNDKKAIELNHGYECFISGIIAQDSGLTKDALGLFDDGAAIFKRQGQEIAYADTLNSKGIIFQLTGFPERSIRCYEESLEIYRKHNSDFRIARACLNISIVHRDTANVQATIKMASEALSIATKHGFTSLEADINRELGVFYKNIQQVDKGFDYLNLALTKYKEDHNAGGEAFCLGNMGLLQAMQGKFQESLDLHNQALNVFTSLSHNLGIANEMANVGNMNCVLRNFGLGLTQLSSALERHRGAGYQYGIATDLKLIGIHFINKGERNKGRQFLEESKDLLIKIGNQQEASQISQILKETE